MKKNICRIITGIFVLGWMLVIFSFSAQPAGKSDDVSGTVAYKVVSAANQLFHGNLTGDEMEAYAKALNHPIRKAAHMTEYAVLGLLCFAFYGSLPVRGKRRYLLSGITAAFYAVTDEIHQLFVPGRAGMLSDVCIDTAGAIIGLFLLFFMMRIWEKIRFTRTAFR